ncbi:hypothetical protein AcV7_006430 [Taiwanofungus camphoratus]|nr:hypothetical protein AcV7_006430 [Antrodia cinnamomea]
MAMEVVSAVASEVFLDRDTSLMLSPPSSVAAESISPKNSSRPLPAIPPALRKLPEPNPLPKSPHIPLRRPSSPFDVAHFRSRSMSVALDASRRALARVVKHPRVLSHLLDLVSWDDFRALSCSCRDFRQIMLRHPRCRDVILSRFVPGYTLAVRMGDLKQYREVKVDFHDLSLLMMSQYVPLHKYPMHSLFILSALAEAVDHLQLYESTAKYAALTQAHSRFVLLLQSLVHSSTGQILPPFGDSEDTLGFLPPPGFRSPQLPGVRELVFPAPLSYFGADHPDAALENTPTTSGLGHRRTSTASALPSARALSLSPTRASGDFQALLGSGLERRKSRLPRVPLFGGPRFPPPPPASEPAVLKYSGWRRASTVAPPRTPFSVADACASDDESKAELPRPIRRFASANHSSESELSSAGPSSRSNTDHTDSSPSASTSASRHTHSKDAGAGVRRESEAAPAPNLAVPQGTSPHDLFLATSRTRAPVLRTFVPCTALDDAAIAACEEQLADAGLWEHLSVGDVVCNLGYVPPADPAHGDDAADAPAQEWLLFSGYGLVPWVPPGPPPLESPLALPSPFYYAHVLPPFAHPVFDLALPALPRSAPDLAAHLQLTLAHVPTRVRSPHSPAGLALVQKYAWLARVPYVGPQAGGALGRGWQGEWMLEGEGTKEGRQSLLDALQAGDADGARARRGEWEVVRDKSGGGRLWMKLLIPNVDPHPADAGPHVPESIVTSPPRTSNEY